MLLPWAQHIKDPMPQTHRSGRAFPDEAQGTRQSLPLVPLQMQKVYVEIINYRFLLPDDCSLSLLLLQRLAKPASLIPISKIWGLLLLLQLAPSIRVTTSRTKPCKTWQHVPWCTCRRQRTTCRSQFSLSPTLPRIKLRRSGLLQAP